MTQKTCDFINDRLGALQHFQKYRNIIYYIQKYYIYIYIYCIYLINVAYRGAKTHQDYQEKLPHS